jgi:hypothetical protein
MSKGRSAVIFVSALLIAGLAGALVDATHRERDREEQLEMLTRDVHDIGRLVRDAPAGAASPSGPLQLDDRQIEAIAARLAARISRARAEGAAPDSKPPVEEKREPTAGQLEAADHAGQIIDHAIARHDLSADDVRTLRQQLRQVDLQTAETLRLKIVTAINRQELKPDPRAGLP